MAKLHTIGCFLSGVVFISSVACAQQSQTTSSPNLAPESTTTPPTPTTTSTPPESVADVPPESASPIAEASQPPSSRPATQTATLTVEGEPEEIQLVLFDSESVPFSTYLPQGEFTDDINSSDEGTSVRFYWTFEGEVDESVYIHVFFPSEAMSLAEIKDFVEGDRGLLASNNWSVTNRLTDVPYDWAKEAIAYEENSEAGYFLGFVLMGAQDDKAFYILSHYPAEYAEGFQPRVEMVLDYLEFKHDSSR
jgi:hypothetical protein